MIDLEKERKLFQDFLTENYDFENHDQTYFDEKTQCYVNDCGEDTEHLNIAWETHRKCAESKQAEIEALKAQQRELNDTVQHLKTESSGVHAALREQQRINEDLLDKLLGVDAGEYVVVPKEPSFQMKQAAYKQYDTGLNSITEIYQAMIEAAQENSHE
ncbi:hypothetical protein [Acinetobacter soli]|uniref:hypothetical protein n=1 Tax=Acinetobacter soli TaxID=487316 RepID=UPI00125F9198|nr:hypothetical protein [Acinetobacter soli]